MFDIGNSLVINGLCKSYGKGKAAQKALDNVSFEVPGNSICGLLGKNGAGKTTLIKCIVGLLIPDAGEITVCGEDVLKNASMRSKLVSVVLDGGRNLFSYMTVRENMRYFSCLRNGIKHTDPDYLDDIIETLHIGEIMDKQIQACSFGMRQRASIAVALACRTRVLFLDEPTTGLDIDYQNELSALLKRLQEKYDCTILVSSHDMHFIEKTCTDCVLIDNGRLIKEGKMSEFTGSFAANQYIIKCRSLLTESMTEEIGKELNIAAVDSDQNTLTVIWQRSDDFCKMTGILGKHGCDVEWVDKSEDLAAAITSLTERRGD